MNEDYWNEGYSAFFDGLSLKDNPYNEHTDPYKYDQWRRGMINAAEPDD